MEIKIPYAIEFKVDQFVPIADIVESLLATELLLRSTGPILQIPFPGLTVDKIDVSVGEITTGSLKELLVATMFVTFQHDLVTEVPSLIADATGAVIPQRYATLATIAFVYLVFQGADLVFQQVNKGAFSRRIRNDLDGAAEELARETGIAKERILEILQSKYGSSFMRIMSRAAIKLFTVSKKANNAPLLLVGREVKRETVADIPSDAQIEEANVPEIVQQHADVEIELHAQDIDRARTGWAAVAPALSPKRLRMELYPPIKPEDIYTRTKIRGDVALVLRKKTDGSYEPSSLHLMQLKS